MLGAQRGTRAAPVPNLHGTGWKMLVIDSRGVISVTLPD